MCVGVCQSHTHTDKQTVPTVCCPFFLYIFIAIATLIIIRQNGVSQPEDDNLLLKPEDTIVVAGNSTAQGEKIIITS